MSTILDKIVADKRREVAECRQRVSEAELERRLADAPPVRDFVAALGGPLTPAPLPRGERGEDGGGPLTPALPRGERGEGGEMAVIAEVKKASPSAGVIRADFDPVAIAGTYARHGAACISVLTDKPYFQGDLAYLTRIRAAVAPPVLRKDFIIDRYQVLEARVAGADAVLLIAEVLAGDELNQRLHDIEQLGMTALVELYDDENLERVVDSGASLIGINNRDLRTFVTRLERTLELAARIPKDRLLVSESGIKTRADVVRLRQAGVKAVLVGETLMASGDIGRKLDELRGVSLDV